MWLSRIRVYSKNALKNYDKSSSKSNKSVRPKMKSSSVSDLTHSKVKETNRLDSDDMSLVINGIIYSTPSYEVLRAFKSIVNSPITVESGLSPKLYSLLCNAVSRLHPLMDQYTSKDAIRFVMQPFATYAVHSNPTDMSMCIRSFFKMKAFTGDASPQDIETRQAVLRTLSEALRNNSASLNARGVSTLFLGSATALRDPALRGAEAELLRDILEDSGLQLIETAPMMEIGDMINCMMALASIPPEVVGQKGGLVSIGSLQRKLLSPMLSALPARLEATARVERGVLKTEGEGEVSATGGPGGVKVATPTDLVILFSSIARMLTTSSSSDAHVALGSRATSSSADEFSSSSSGVTPVEKILVERTPWRLLFSLLLRDMQGGHCTPRDLVEVLHACASLVTTANSRDLASRLCAVAAAQADTTRLFPISAAVNSYLAESPDFYGRYPMRRSGDEALRTISQLAAKEITPLVKRLASDSLRREGGEKGDEGGGGRLSKELSVSELSLTASSLARLMPHVALHRSKDSGVNCLAAILERIVEEPGILDAANARTLVNLMHAIVRSGGFTLNEEIDGKELVDGVRVAFMHILNRLGDNVRAHLVAIGHAEADPRFAAANESAPTDTARGFDASLSPQSIAMALRLIAETGLIEDGRVVSELASAWSLLVPQGSREDLLDVVAALAVIAPRMSQQLAEVEKQIRDADERRANMHDDEVYAASLMHSKYNPLASKQAEQDQKDRYFAAKRLRQSLWDRCETLVRATSKSVKDVGSRLHQAAGRNALAPPNTPPLMPWPPALVADLLKHAATVDSSCKDVVMSLKLSAGPDVSATASKYLDVSSAAALDARVPDGCVSGSALTNIAEYLGSLIPEGKRRRGEHSSSDADQQAREKRRQTTTLADHEDSAPVKKITLEPSDVSRIMHALNLLSHRLDGGPGGMTRLADLVWKRGPASLSSFTAAELTPIAHTWARMKRMYARTDDVVDFGESKGLIEIRMLGVGEALLERLTEKGDRLPSKAAAGLVHVWGKIGLRDAPLLHVLVDSVLDDIRDKDLLISNVGERHTLSVDSVTKMLFGLAKQNAYSSKIHQPLSASSNELASELVSRLAYVPLETEASAMDVLRLLGLLATWVPPEGSDDFERRQRLARNVLAATHAHARGIEQIFKSEPYWVPISTLACAALKLEGILPQEDKEDWSRVMAPALAEKFASTMTVGDMPENCMLHAFADAEHVAAESRAALRRLPAGIKSYERDVIFLLSNLAKEQTALNADGTRQIAWVSLLESCAPLTVRVAFNSFSTATPPRASAPADADGFHEKVVVELAIPTDYMREVDGSQVEFTPWVEARRRLLSLQGWRVADVSFAEWEGACVVKTSDGREEEEIVDPKEAGKLRMPFLRKRVLGLIGGGVHEAPQEKAAVGGGREALFAKISSKLD